jgi:hypothetical protein
MRNNASNARFASANSSSSMLDDDAPGFLDKGRAAGFDRHARNRAFKDRNNQRRFDRLARRNRHDDSNDSFED